MSVELAARPPIVTKAATPARSQLPPLDVTQAMSNAIASVEQTPGALSARSIVSTAGPDLGNLHELVNTMKGTLDHLGGVFDSLGEQ